MINQKSFRCLRCADCCKHLIVKLYKGDISKIKKEGYGDFFVYDNHIKSNVLKQKNFKCVFLSKKKGEYYCKIYSIRPKVCRGYPFVENKKVDSCKPMIFGKL
jgi:Fe-S-cluster containining protein